MRNRKIYDLLLVLVLLSVICSFVLSVPTSSIVITNTGTVVATTVMASSGSPNDIQAAINVVEAAGGGTVIIPAGNWTFNPPAGGVGVTIAVSSTIGVSLIGQVENQTVLWETTETNSTMIQVATNEYPYTNPSQPFRMSNLWLHGNVSYHGTGSTDNQLGSGIKIYRVSDYMIDHCIFENFPNFGMYISANTGGTGKPACRGVISHCKIDNPYKTEVYNDSYSASWGYGIGIEGSDSWDNTTGATASAFGNYGGHEYSIGPTPHGGTEPYNYGGGITYIEDCNFRRCRHSIAGALGGAGYYVVRHCYFSQEEWYGMIDAHGGTFGFEAYNNTFICGYVGPKGEGYQAPAFLIRGGSALIYNNTIINCTGESGIVMIMNDGQPVYQRCHDTWIWSNILINSTDPLINNADTGVVENVSYFLHGPKPGYTAYPYPFPFISGSQLQPAWDRVNQNSTAAGSACQLSIYWKNMSNPYFGLTNSLSHYYLESNQTGTMQNSTITAFVNGAPQWTNFTITLPSSGVVAWRVHANNTAGQWATFCWQYDPVS